jgi:UDP-apiose/xylose synthase
MDFLPGIDGEGIPRVFACFMDALLFNKPMQLVDGGKNRRTFCAISDAVDAIVGILERPGAVKNEIINIGNPDNEIFIVHLADMMRSLYGELCPKKRDIPEIITVSSADFYGKGYEDCDRRAPDISKAQQLLGWKPKTGIKTAVRETMASYIRYYEKECAA